MLTPEQIVAFEQDGYLMLENAIPQNTLADLKAEFEKYKEESRAHAQSYGTTFDNRARFDLEPGHSSDAPALRRIASPVELSDVWLNFMRDGEAVDACVDLLGSNIRFCNSKINSKQPGAATAVKYHQDFLFELHSNDDLIAVLYFLDEVTLENGPLEVVPGSHKGALHEHWHDGVFTGTVAIDVARDAKANSVSCVGPAGSACLMHTRLLHGSAPNRSTQPRTLYICSYRAEDALPLQDNHIPSVYMDEVVRGVDTGRVRCADIEMALSEVPKGASFFEQQAADDTQ